MEIGEVFNTVPVSFGDHAKNELEAASSHELVLHNICILFSQ